MSSVTPDTHAEDLADLRRFAQQGDRAALGRLFTRHADAAYRLALRYFTTSADAEDAVQVAFLRVLRLAGQFRGETTVKAWIMGSVVSACRHKLREDTRRSTREQHAARPEVNLPSPADREQSEAVLRAVQDLPEHYRTPVWLHYYEGMSSPEIAATLELSENTVRSQMNRGVERLRAALAATGCCLTVPALTTALAAVPAEAAPATLTAALSSMALGGAAAASGGTAGAVASKVAALAKAAVATKAGIGVVTVTLAAVGGVWMATRPSAPALPTPVALWKFDEGSGVAASDSSGNGNHGALKGGVTWVKDGKLGGALRFDGSSGYVDIGRSPRLDFAGTITVAAWIKPERVGADNVVVGKGFTGAITPFWLSLMGPNRARFGHFANGYHMAEAAIPSGSFTDGAWHHLAGVYDGTAYRLYIDSKPVASTKDPVGISTGPNAVEIGRINENGGTKHFAGLIDEVNIFREPLTDAQVAALAAQK
jgi:RNA polymerase sigma factor (sigma-70 family)